MAIRKSNEGQDPVIFETINCRNENLCWVTTKIKTSYLRTFTRNVQFLICVKINIYKCIKDITNPIKVIYIQWKYYF